MSSGSDKFYYSLKDRTLYQAFQYSQTHTLAFRYLAFRDIHFILNNKLNGKRAVDFGSGTGYSTQFLHKLDFDVFGVDKSFEMIYEAKLKYPYLKFCHNEKGIIPSKNSFFDLVFSSFVLFEMGKDKEILDYLLEAKRVMKKNGLFVAITGSQDLHSYSRKWLSFCVDFPENEHLFSGKSVRLFLNGANMEFKDYYWTENDYSNFFSEAGFDLLELHYPLGRKSDPYEWKDESLCSPFLILVAKIRENSVEEKKS